MLNQKEITQLENVLRAFKKATFNDMQGLEVLALASAVHWLNDFIAMQKAMPEQVKPKRAKK